MRDHTKLSLALAAGGIALTAYGFLEERRIDHQHSREAFALESENRIDAIDREMSANLAGIQAVRAHVRDAALDRDSFDRFAMDTLSAFPSISAIEWAPVVQDRRRTAFESEVAVPITEGTPTHPRLAAKRPEYCPVQFLYPHTDGAKGFDLCAAKALREPLQRSKTSGGVSLTRRIKLLEKSAGGYGVSAVIPVLSSDSLGVTGYVIAVIQIPVVVDRALQGVHGRGFHVEIADASEVGENTLLYRGNDPMSPSTEFEYSKNLDFGGRTWRLSCAATPAYLGGFQNWHAWGLLFSGLCITALGVTHIEVTARQTSRAQTLVEQLSNVNRQLKAEVEERKRAEEALEAARDQALAAATAKAQFLANMSHEIRTPMNGLLGMTELALAGQLDPEQRGNLEFARSSGQNLAQLLNDILDFSRAEAGKLSLESLDFALRDELESVVRLFANQAESKGLPLEVEYGPDLPDRVSGDPVRLKQVIANLLSNAVKFTDAGQIVVRATMDSADEKSAILRFAIRDTGPGVPAEVQAKLFSPFTQADGSTTRRYGGSGLGLAICKQIVHLMGGEIGLTSQPGAGAEFWFTARVAPARQQRGASPLPVNDGTTFNLRVLVAEDNAVNQLVARGLLEKLGCQVEVASNGLAAVKLWTSGMFDVIFMDCQMPGMDGYEATSYIRSTERPPRRVPIIALTAHALAGDRERCLLAGMDDYLTKPIQLADLISVLSRIHPVATTGNVSDSVLT